MKHIALLLSLTSTLFLQTQASEDVEKTLKSKITNVTVFMQGAQVTRTGSTDMYIQSPLNKTLRHKAKSIEKLARFKTP